MAGRVCVCGRAVFNHCFSLLQLYLPKKIHIRQQYDFAQRSEAICLYMYTKSESSGQNRYRDFQ